MSLTPDDVHNKQFTTVRFAEGYKVDEVDDFLDRIEVAMKELVSAKQDAESSARGEIPSSVTQELEDLKSDNSSLTSEVNSLNADKSALAHEVEQLKSALELAQSGDNVQVVADTSAADELRAQLESVQAQLQSAQAELQTVTAQKDELAAQVEQLSTSSAPAVSASLPSDIPAASLRMLEIAQRTADETTAAAQIEADKLVADASATAETVKADSEAEANRLVTDAQIRVAGIRANFEAEEAALERKVEELRAYEREYRGRLRSYLEGQLRELESKNFGGDVQITAE